jgi:hypothetical protein
MARAADFDLAAELAKPSFTASVRDAPALVELVIAGDDRAPAALAGLGERARAALVEHLGIADEAARAHVVAALGLIARRGDEVAKAIVIAQLIADASSRVRRAAISALGKLGGEAPELLARWDAADVPPDERRALAEALGKVGGDAALARLRALEPGGDVELARRRDRALLVADRGARRGEDSAVRDDVPPPSPVTVVLRCKPGLAALLAETVRGRVRDDATVELELARPWSSLWASRLWITAGIRVPRPEGELADSIVRGIVAARPLLAAWTRGAIRWRLELATKQRATIWRVARDVTQLAPELVNDPTATTWDVLVDGDALELRPRRVADPRFAYRVAEIPAASHPTVAATLAYVAEARATDRVWDPFVGSGLELVERARLGPARPLAGTDLAEAAVVAARANLAAAGVEASVALGDSRAATGTRDLDLVITNPPLGSRVQVDAAGLLAELLPVIARRLAPGGRLVWITPAPPHTAKIAERLGLRRTRAHAVDLGGVRGQLERWDAGR